MNSIETASDDIVQRTSDVIRRQIGSRRIALASAAREVAMSARTLQRRLHEAHTNFAALLTAVRIELAREHLGRGGNVTQLAHQLGFSESSAVSRFLHEHGFTPPALRIQGRARLAGINGGNFDRVVETIYGEEGPERWNNAVMAVAPYLDSPIIRAWVMEAESTEPVFDAYSPEVAPDNIKRYDQRYFESDPRIAGVLQRLGLPVSCIDVTDPAEFDKTPLVSDILDRPEVGARWTMIQAQRLCNGHTVFLGAARPRRQGPYLEPDKRRLNSVFSHVRRALALELRFGAVDHNKRTLESVLDVMPQAVIVVSNKLDVLYANRRGAELIGSGTGLSMVHGKLHAMRAREQTALEGVVSAAGHGDGGATVGFTAAHGFAIIGRAFRLPRVHFVAGGENDWQCALILTSEEWEIDATVEAMATALTLGEAEQNSLRQILRDAPSAQLRKAVGTETAGRPIAQNAGALRADLVRLVKRSGT